MNWGETFTGGMQVTAKRWQSRLFTSSGTWTVPADVGVIWIDGCAGGGGGGGGDPTPGGGGGGGQCGFALRNYVVCVAPGDVVTLTVGAGGVAGSAGNDGSTGGLTKVELGGVAVVRLMGGYGGNKGTPSAGGDSKGALPYGASGTGWVVGSTTMPSYAPLEAINSNNLGYFSSTAGGALNVAGGARIASSIASGGIYNVGAAGGAAGGGGGHGATGPYTFDANGGLGGANGAAGGNANGYGGGGGGGSGNSAGGNGAPGFIRIYCFSATTI